MAFLGSAIVRLGVDDKDLVRGYERAIAKTQAFADVTDRVGRSMSVGLTAPLTLFGGAVLAATGNLESLKLGLTAVAGSADEAEKQFARLSEIAKLPGIGFEEAIAGSVRLQAVGFSAAGSERALKAFSNAIALTGGGAAQLESVTVQLGQLASKGKILAQDLRPIIEASPAVGRALREAFGAVDSEQIQKLNLSTEQFLGTLLSKLEELPHVQGGLKNAFQNLADTGKRALGSLAADEAVNLAAVINHLADGVEHAAKVFTAIDPTTKRVAVGILAIAAAAGPASFAISKIATGFTLARAAMTVLSGLPAKLGASFALLNNTLIATRAGLNFNAAAGQFATASGVFVARAAVMRAAAAGTSISFALMKVAGAGLVGFLTGPVGITLALTAATAAFLHYKVKAAEAKVATDDFAASVATLNSSLLGLQQADLASQFEDLSAQLESIPRQIAQVSAGPAGMGPVVTTMVDNPAFKDAEFRLGVLRTQLEAVTAAADSLAETSQSTTLGDFGSGATESAMDALAKTIQNLLSIYDSLNDRGQSTTAILGELLQREHELQQIIAHQGNQRTEDLAKALDLSNRIKSIWDSFKPSGNLAVNTPDPFSTKGAAGTERAEIVLQAHAKALRDAMTVTAQVIEGAAAVPLVQRVKNLADAFQEARENVLKEEKLGALDRLELRLLQFAETVGTIAGTLERSVRHPLEGMENILKGFAGAASRGIGFLAALVNPITLFQSTLDQVARNLAPDFSAALAPLEPVFKDLADAITPIVAAIAQAFGPVFKALVPIFQKLGPVIAAIANTLAPLLTAVVPLLDVFRIVLEALFPVIKGVAIAATYLGQIFFSIASGVSQALGYLILAIGKAIDAIPFVNGNPIKNAGRALIEMGEAAWKAVGDLGDAREQIKDIQIGDALDSVADAASRAADALTNIPQIFDYALRRRMAALAGATAPAATGGVGTTAGTPGRRSEPGGTQSAGGPSYTFIIQNPPAGMDARGTEQWLAQQMEAPGTNRLKAAVQTLVDQRVA